MKKVLIIAYYWPPSGGGGVQRWLKFSRYLREFGWEPIVYTPQDADYPILDRSLEEEIPEGMEVIRHPIWEPRKLYQRFTRKKKTQKKSGPTTDQIFYVDPKERSWKQNVSVWIRGNGFIPDARVFWVKPSIRFLKDYLKQHPVDAMVTTGPPHSLHLIGRALQKHTAIPWVADFRDPWTEIEFYDKLMLTSWADRKHHRLEEAVIREADGVSMVAYHWTEKYKQMGAKHAVTITNGYDERDFPDVQIPLSEHFVLSHVGTFADDRNAPALWKALQELKATIPGFSDRLRLHFVGKLGPGVVRSLEAHGLADHLLPGGYVSHEEAVAIMRRSQVLLLLINRSAENAPGRMTGKIFEYLAARRPILCVGEPESDPARVLTETQAGVTAHFDEVEKIQEILTDMYQQYLDGELKVNSQGYQRFSRRSTAQQMAELLEHVSVAAQNAKE